MNRSIGVAHRALALTAMIWLAACTQLLGNDFYILGGDDGSTSGTAGDLNGPGGASSEGGTNAIGGGGTGGAAIGGGGAGGTGGMGGTGGTGGGVGGTGGGGHCSTSEAEPIPLDLFMLADVTGSMTQGNRWTTLEAELNTYFDSEVWKPTRVALSFFPALNATCDASNWNPPQQALTDLVAHANLTNALAAMGPQGQSPMGAAMDATYAAASAHAGANPESRVVVVLMADGDISSCQPSSLDAVASAAATALSSRGVLTYTIVLATAANLPRFDAIAASGGTTAAHVAPDSVGTDDILQVMRDQLHHCAHRHPFPGAPPSELTLFYDDATIPHVSGQTACGGGPGWYESADGTIQLCSQTCRSTTATSTLSVERCR